MLYIILEYLDKHQNKETIKQEIDIYRYGLEVFILNFLNIISILLLGYLSNTFLEALIFLITFIILRQLTGGFHFKSYILCNFSFICMYLLFLLFYYLRIWELIQNIYFIIINSCLIYIMYMTPIENVNKPLSKNKLKILKIKKFYISLIFLCVYMILKPLIIMNAMAYAIILDVLLIIIEKVKEVLKDEKINL